MLININKLHNIRGNRRMENYAKTMMRKEKEQ